MIQSGQRDGVGVAVDELVAVLGEPGGWGDDVAAAAAGVDQPAELAGGVAELARRRAPGSSGGTRRTGWRRSGGRQLAAGREPAAARRHRSGRWSCPTVRGSDGRAWAGRCRSPAGWRVRRRSRSRTAGSTRRGGSGRGRGWRVAPRWCGRPGSAGRTGCSWPRCAPGRPAAWCRGRAGTRASRGPRSPGRRSSSSSRYARAVIIGRPPPRSSWSSRWWRGWSV